MAKNNPLIENAAKAIFYGSLSVIRRRFEYHERLIYKISGLLNQELNNLSKEFDAINKSHVLTHSAKEQYLMRIEEEGHHHDIYDEVLYNSIFINLYSIVENALYEICISHYSLKEIKDKNKKENTGDIRKFTNLIRKKINRKVPILPKKLDQLDDKYRILRNILVHNRFACNLEKKTILKDLEGLRFDAYHGQVDTFRVTIIDKDFILTFLNLSRDFVLEVYKYYHASIKLKSYKK